MRVVSNYLRLSASLAAGVLTVRTLLQLGDTAYGVIVVLMMVIGFAMMALEVLTTALVPEYGRSASRTGPRRAATEQAAARLAFEAALATPLALAAVAVAIPWLGVPPNLVTACQGFLIARGVEWFAAMRTAPHRAALLCQERVPALNAWIVAERAIDASAALAAITLAGVDDPTTAILLYGLLAAIASTLLHFAATRIVGVRGSHEPCAADRQRVARRRLLRSIRANASLGVAISVFLRFPTLLVQVAAGPAVAGLFGLACQFTYYVRQAAVGMVLGVEGVASKFAATGVREVARREIDVAVARHGWFILPVGLAAAAYSEPLIAVWAGESWSSDRESLRLTSELVRWLMLGVAARALADPWLAFAAGAGLAERVAKPVVIGAAAGLVMLPAAWALAPVDWAPRALAAAVSMLLATVYLIGVPGAIAHRAGVPFWTMLRPIARPAAAVIGGLVVGWLASAMIGAPAARWAPPIAAVFYAAVAGATSIDAAGRRSLATRSRSGPRTQTPPTPRCAGGPKASPTRQAPLLSPTTQMRVLVNATTLHSGGGLQVGVSLISHMIGDPKGVDWRFVVSPPVAQELEALGVRLPDETLVCGSPTRDRAARRTLLEYSDRVAADVAFTVFGPAYVRFNVPHLMGVADGWTTHPSRLAYQSLRGPLERARFAARGVLKGRWYCQADAWIVEADCAANGLSRRFGVPRDRVSTIPNACSHRFREAAGRTPFPRPCRDGERALDRPSVPS